MNENAPIILSEFVAGYIEALYFTDAGPDDEIPADAEFSTEAREAAEADCKEFISAAGSLLEDAVNLAGYNSTRAGHDFWFTRNGHGVGFWCRDELNVNDLGNRLSEVAKKFGEAYPYLGDDGHIYF